MYGIIREGNRKYYITKILGFYGENGHRGGSLGQFFIVLDRAKKSLIKVYQYNPEVRPELDLRVILLDDDTSDWVLDSYEHGCVEFLAQIENIVEKVEHNSLEPWIIEKCVEYDVPSDFKEVNEIKTQEDAQLLMELTCEFHDAIIEELEKREDGSLRVHFTGIWGVEVELYFEGEVTYCTDSRDPDLYDPYWQDSQVAIKDGFITFYDDAYTDVEEINDGWCWFRARKMSYRIIIQ